MVKNGQNVQKKQNFTKFSSPKKWDNKKKIQKKCSKEHKFYKIFEPKNGTAKQKSLKLCLKPCYSS